MNKSYKETVISPNDYGNNSVSTETTFCSLKILKLSVVVCVDQIGKERKGLTSPSLLTG